MRIAVVGSGISGLICARLLGREHEITVFEADSRVGGHTNTVSVDFNGERHEIDTGFIVYNERTYPNFTRVLADLDVRTAPSAMSFSVRCDQTGLEYNGTSLNGLFAQRRNILRPSFLRMLHDILMFNREGARDLERVPRDQTVGDYLRERNYSRQFSDRYLLPMGAAIWSCPCANFADFPIHFILEFYVNHGLLSIRDRPTWRVIEGGSREYVRRLIAPFKDHIRLNAPVESIVRNETDVLINTAYRQESFDEIIIACHSDQALSMLNDADSVEQDVLSAFPYSENLAVLHTDESVLPKRRRAWAAWNYHIAGDNRSRPTVTYNMNILQHIQSAQTFCVTLNSDEVIDPRKIVRQFRYSHPLFTTDRERMQKRHSELIRHRRTSYCGAYWRNGFHEDGVVSALAVCRRFGIPDWTPTTAGTIRTTKPAEASTAATIVVGDAE